MVVKVVGIPVDKINAIHFLKVFLIVKEQVLYPRPLGRLVISIVLDGFLLNDGIVTLP